MLISLPLAFWRPFWGLLIYAWLAYMRPQDLAWAVARDARFSQWVAVAMLLGLVLWLGRERLATFEPQTILLLLLVLWVTSTVANARAAGDVADDLRRTTGRSILISVLTTGLVRSRERFRLLLLVTAFSLGLLGLKCGIHRPGRQGARFDHGPGGFMRDNNDLRPGPQHGPAAAGRRSP